MKSDGRQPGMAKHFDGRQPLMGDNLSMMLFDKGYLCLKTTFDRGQPFIEDNL